MVVEIAIVKQFTVKVVAEAVAVAAVGSGIRSSSSRSSSSHRKGSFSREVFLPGGIPPCPLVGGPLGALEGTPYGLHHSLHHIYICLYVLYVSYNIGYLTKLTLGPTLGCNGGDSLWPTSPMLFLEYVFICFINVS